MRSKVHINLKEKPVISLFLIALTLRLFWMMIVLVCNSETGFYDWDTDQYWAIAQSLNENGEFAYYNGNEVYYIHSRLPGYPIFITPFQNGSLNLSILIIFQCILGALTSSITFKIACLFGLRKRYAFLAGLITAFHFPSIIFSCLVMSETLFAFLFVCSTYFWLQGLINNNRKSIMLGALILGLSIYVRPVSLYLPFVLPFASLFFMKSWKDKVAASLIVISIPLLVISPWIIRNKMVFDKVFVSTNGDFNLLYFRAAGAMCEAEGISLDQAIAQLKSSFEKEFGKEQLTRPIEAQRVRRQIAINYILENKWALIKSTSKSLIRFSIYPIRATVDHQIGHDQYVYSINQFGKEYSTSVAKRLTASSSKITIALMFYQIIWSILIWVGFLLSILYGSNRKSKIYWIGVFILAYFAVVSAGPESGGRLLIPIAGILSVLSVLGWKQILNKRSFF